MRKIVLFIAALLFMAVPVMAVSNVDINCTASGNWVTVSYTSNLNRIRAFALDINTNGANITDVCSLNTNYRIYPGQISIVDGNVNAYGTPYDPCELNSPKVTIEMGSLYTLDSNYAGDPNAGYLTQPPGLGPSNLLKFRVAGACHYVVDVNLRRGGIVMEDPDEQPTDNLPYDGNVVLECYVWEGQTQAQYDNWVEVNKPECWCYPRQCHGDADGKAAGNAFIGFTYVDQPDLSVMAVGWKVRNPPQGTGILNLSFNGIPAACADFAHDKVGNIIIGYTRIDQTDLTIMSTYWKVMEPPKTQQGRTPPPTDCVPGNRNPP
jgi:hypothetical protein